MLECVSTELGYGGILMQADDKGALHPVGCVSSLHERISASDIESILQAVAYCLRKFHDVV